MMRRAPRNGTGIRRRRIAELHSTVFYDYAFGHDRRQQPGTSEDNDSKDAYAPRSLCSCESPSPKTNSEQLKAATVEARLPVSRRAR